MYKDMSINCIRKTIFNILLHFKAFCEKNEIGYFLSNGTLLGAVKYKGFIPWDDDIDVILPREDYDRLVRCYEDSDRYRLYSYERNTSFRYPFAKLCDMTTCKEEFNINNNVMLGLDIDIFPIDIWPNDIKKASRLVKRVQCIRDMLYFSKYKKATSKSPVKKVIQVAINYVFRSIGSKYFVERIINIAIKHKSHQSPRYIGCIAWPHRGEVIPIEVFEDTIEVEFEGIKFPAPIGYDTYLRSIYGDYTKELPHDKQVSHHMFRAYKI